MKIPSLPPSQQKAPWHIIIDTFKGVATLLDDIILGNKFAKEALNLMLTQDGRWSTRWGSEYYGQAIPGEEKIVFCATYRREDQVQEKIAIAGSGKAYRSVDQGAWSVINGATFNTNANHYSVLQKKWILYIANGYDNLTRLTSAGLQRYTSISAPTGLTGTRNVLTDGSYTNYYRITALNDVGETIGSVPYGIKTNKPRNMWIVSQNEYITLSWNSVSGATRYQVYYAEEQGKEVLLADTSTSFTTFKDDGQAAQNPLFECPQADTTGAPKFKDITDSGSRFWGITDDTVYWSGTGNQYGVFSEFYGGGWQPLVSGTDQTLESIRHFRDGKGNNAATVLARTKSGIGSVWQIPLTVGEVAETSIIIPDPMQLPGPIGTVAPYGVIEANDSLYVPNARGIFSLNNKANVTNILSTGEMSGNIRPSFRDLINIEDIAGIWFDSKLIWTASESGKGNDIIFGYDTEYNEWFWKWTIGFRHFLEVTEDDGTTRLVGVPNNGAQLVEISANIKGDLGKPFRQSWMSGLIPVSRDSMQLAKVMTAAVELGRPAGTIFFEILGIDEKRGFSSVGERQITSAVSNIDFVNVLWDDYFWDFVENTPQVFASASIKKAKSIRKTVSAVQFHVYSVDTDATWTLLKVQSDGFYEKKVPKKYFK